MKILRDIIILGLVLAISMISQAKGYTTPSTLFVGDSLAVGTAPYIKVRGMKVDARIGRPLREGMAMIEKYPRPKRLLISLGSNNYPPSLPEVQQAVSYSLLRADCVVWATVHVRSLNYDVVNRWLRRRAGKRFKVVRWARQVDRHPELLAGDGVHATAHGYYVRSRMYVKEMHKCP
jgi:hypothetical protein